MKQKQNLEVEKDEIQKIGLTALKNYLLIDPSEIDDKNALVHLLNKAKLGMQFEREMNISKRTFTSQTIRIHTLTTEDKKELKKLLKESLPDFF